MKSIPLLPNTVALSLQDDFIHFVSELKFLLLFFEKPRLILHSNLNGYLNPSLVKRIRAGKSDDEVEEIRKTIRNIDFLKYEEWDDLVAVSEPSYMQVCEGEGVNTSSEYLRRAARVEEVLGRIGFSCRGFYQHATSQNIPATFEDKVPLLDMKGITEETKSMLFVAHIGMFRLVDVLDQCTEHNIPMIWSRFDDLTFCKLYGESILEKMKEGEVDEEDEALLRQVRGDQLLKQVMDLGIVNVAAVPLNRVLEFKKSNRDLLDTFLTFYRDFLTELQVTPTDIDAITLRYGQKIVHAINQINSEISLASDSAKLKWMGKVSEGAAEFAKKGVAVAVWNFFSSPLALAASGLTWLGSRLSSGALQAAGDALERRKVLVRSNAGYLWKAKQEFS